MSWIKERAKAFGHGVEKTIKSIIKNTNEHGYYVGYKANGDGTDGQYYVQAGPIEYNSEYGFKTNIPIEQTPSYPSYEQTSYTPKPRPNSGYSRNVAATAKDIAQGGMTKDEVIEFNMRHPNETAKRSE